jgi:hypothetical protein
MVTLDPGSLKIFYGLSMSQTTDNAVTELTSSDAIILANASALSHPPDHRSNTLRLCCVFIFDLLQVEVKQG